MHSGRFGLVRLLASSFLHRLHPEREKALKVRPWLLELS